MMHATRWFWLFIVWVPHKGWSVDLAKPTVVPSVVKFADMHLKLTRGVRKEIQERVDRLRQSRRLFAQILERTHLFFPFIEQILAAEGVPEDFKFQALHESMLVGDAVSLTNDVGFWQIHRVAALDLKLNIDYPIDERMHLIESTKAAARFLKSHHRYFNSWLGALLAYNRGRAGVIRRFPKSYYSTKRVCLDDPTDPYIIAVIATKIAFESIAGKQAHPKWKLRIYHQGHHGHKLEDIAQYLRVEAQTLLEHNRWLKTTVIPHHTRCALVVPLLHTHPMTATTLSLPPSTITPTLNQVVPPPPSPLPITSNHGIDYEKHLHTSKVFPEITTLTHKLSPRLIKANGKLAIIAQAGDNLAALAHLGRLSIDKFMAINEIEKDHPLVPGHIYYYHTKGTKGGIHYHIVAVGESLWHIAQKYGIKQAALLEKNRLQKESVLEAGRILWLRFIRPRKIPVAYK